MAFSKSHAQGAPERRAVDASTLAVAAAVYAGWIFATLAARALPPLLLATLGGWLIAWHGSLQHETIHGHPTPWRWVNRLLGFAPLNLWLPYARYERLHLDHHRTEHLTVPGLDPEARYIPAASGPLRRAAAWTTAPLAGRLLFGPPLEIADFLWSEARAVIAGEPGVRRAWAIHLLGVAAVVAWLVFVARLSLASYVLYFVYPGCALSLLRSFAEHRAHADPARRVAVVERAPLFGLLFLNNNLHAVHHAFPGAPWRRLPALYAEHREALLQANGALVYSGYGEVIGRYLLRPHDRIVHPAATRPRVEEVA
jgi:fatty acid desaturase